MFRHIVLTLTILVVASHTFGGQISEDQQRFIKKYEKHAKVVPPGQALINADPEPKLDSGFVDLYNGNALKSDWKDLFANGDFSEWSQVNGEPVSEDWSIKDGVVHRAGKLAGSINTKAVYKDFELRFDWKISEAGNSGIKYRVRKHLGLEYQILDDAKHSDGKKISRRAASLYDIQEADLDKPLNPPGEWNSGRIVIKGDKLEHWLNGKLVASIEIGSENWKERFQKSKYNKHEGFGTWEGPIYLQDHYDEVWYRNMHIREL